MAKKEKQINVSILVPVYNEEDAVLGTIAKIQKTMGDAGFTSFELIDRHIEILFPDCLDGISSCKNRFDHHPSFSQSLGNNLRKTHFIINEKKPDNI